MTHLLQLLLDALQLLIACIELRGQRQRSFRLIASVLQQRPAFAIALRRHLGIAGVRFANAHLEIAYKVAQFLFLVLQRGAQLFDVRKQVGFVRSKFSAVRLEVWRDVEN